MELPDFLANMKVDDYQNIAFIEALLTEGPCGVIVKGTAFFDDPLLKQVLLAYRPRPGRVAKFSPTDVEKLKTFDSKVKALAVLDLDGAGAPLRDLAVAKLTPMRKIRNKAAHVTKLARAEAEELWADEGNRNLLDDFPNNFNAECAAVQDALQRLLAHPDFTTE
ncbi:MAG: hypothetical protein U0792_17880 [Gemmataceae bacterium]